MARLLFPLLLIGLGVLGLVEHDTINGQWAEMYPEDAARRDALTRCAAEEGSFNRFTISGRASCYQKYLQVELAPTAPAIAVGIPGAPAHAVPHPPPVRTNNNQR